MICPFCNQPVEQAIAETLMIIDGSCPSSCDDGVLLRALCTSCGRTVFAKTVLQAYVTQHFDEFPKWVKFGAAYAPNFTHSEYDDDDHYVYVHGDRVYLGARAATIAAGNLDDPLPDNMPPGAELKIYGGRWYIEIPPQAVCELIGPVK